MFGLSWVDFLRDEPVKVEMEKDLSIKVQLLDVVLIRKGPGPLGRRMPDGFEDLRPHNLITFKSFQEPLDGWALNELLGHYVNYRKQVSPNMQKLLPESDFGLFAVTVHYPRDLANTVGFRPVSAGVYDVAHFTGTLRVIVVHQLPKEAQYSLMLVFSAKQDLVQYGVENYQPRSQELTTLLDQLFERYREGGVGMPYTMEEFMREAFPKLLAKVPPEERVKGLPPEVLLKALPPEERVKGMTPAELLQSLSPEVLAALVEQAKARADQPKQE